MCSSGYEYCVIVIHIFFPSLGLRFLVRLCTDLGLKEASEYATKLKKAEKAKEVKIQVNK